jgi:hypothetical protein
MEVEDAGKPGLSWRRNGEDPNDVARPLFGLRVCGIIGDDIGEEPSPYAKIRVRNRLNIILETITMRRLCASPA